MPAGVVITVQKITSLIDPLGKGIDPPTPAVVSHVITTVLMVYDERVSGVYKRSIFQWYLKSFTPEFSHENPLSIRFDNENAILCLIWSYIFQLIDISKKYVLPLYFSILPYKHNLICKPVMYILLVRLYYDVLHNNIKNILNY